MDEIDALPIKKEKYSDAFYLQDAVLYFIAAGRPIQAIKIGVAGRKRIENRLRELQSSNHEVLELLGIIEFPKEKFTKPMVDAEARERGFHTQFADLQRLKKWGVGYEWFNPGEGLLHFIAQNTHLPDALKSKTTVTSLSDYKPIDQ